MKDLQLVPCIEKSSNEDLIDSLLEIYRELPRPLQFTREDFVESVHDDSNNSKYTKRLETPRDQ